MLIHNGCELFREFIVSSVWLLLLHGGPPRFTQGTGISESIPQAFAKGNPCCDSEFTFQMGRWAGEY